MRQILLAIAVPLLTASAAGCGKATDEPMDIESELSGVADEKLDVAIAVTQVATRAIEGYAFEQRAKFTADRKAELVTMQADLDQLSVKAESATDAAKADLASRLEVLRAKWAEAKRQLDRAESATESNWDNVQSGFNESYGELQAAFDEARHWLSDEIES